MSQKRGVKAIELLSGVDFTSAQVYTRVVDLKDYPCVVGRFAMQAKGTTGTGQIDITMTVSIDGVNYFAVTTPAILSNVVTTAQQAEFDPFNAIFCRYIKFVFTEDGTSTLAGFSATVIVQ